MAPGQGPRTAIIGAGLGGVACAVNLQRAGLRQFEVFEKASGPGGVWWYNSYPGCEVDVDSRAYSYSFMPYAWQRTHAPQAEVQRYVQHVIDHFRVGDRLSFGVTVTAVRWNDTTSTYTLQTSQGDAGPFDMVVCSTGMLSNPALPTWPGLEAFRGPVFHTSEYDHGVDITGKRVALVGTGSTACQLAPVLARTAGHLDLYQREPGYVLPKKVREFTPQERETLLRSPIKRRVERFKLFRAANVATKAFNAESPEQARIRQYHTKLLARTVDDDAVRAALTPDYPYGCKRPVFASDYYPMFNRENVRLVPHAVQTVAANGVIAADGIERPADVIVLATGFQATRYLAGIDVVGRHGRRLHDQWGDEPSAFLGMTVPGFPNFFMTYGPNTNGGWSIIAQLERQSEVIVRAAKRLDGRRGRVIDTRAGVARRYDAFVQRSIHKRRNATEAGCHNYFRAPSGKNVTQWPYSSAVYLVATRLLAPIGLKTR